MLDMVWLMPLIMAASFVVILFFGQRLPKKGAEVGVLAIVANFVLASWAVIDWVRRPIEAAAEGESGGGEGEATEHAMIVGRSLHGVGRFAARMAEEGGHGIRHAVDKSISWWHVGPVDIRLGIHVDGFTVSMLFLVTFVSACVHIFSLEYMRDDRRFGHYYAALSLFTCGMLLMVVSSNTLQMLFGWEIMGLCSFMLIGHWWEEQPNTDAALKAFFTTRTGDIGLLVGISILFFAAGHTFDIAETNALALNGGISHLVALVAACSLFAAVVGKSAQFPLHTWLPDAMAGPTPGSALIHAATMVVAGVYLFARLYGVFFQGFSIKAGGVNLGAAIGAITLVMAALLAFVQDDIKKVLAYSTVSQLGYMVMGLGVGAWTGAIFHLFTHAFFKALLFLGAGSISHSGSHHSFDMKTSMGGLRKHMPVTFATFTAGYLALAGIIPFAGFWSKDEILLGAKENGFVVMYIAASFGAFCTAAYMTRVMWLTFFGEYRGGHAAHDEHAARVMAMAGHGTIAHDTARHDDHGHDDHGHATAAVHDDHGHGAAAHDDHGHGDHGDAHAGPHESNWLILGPLVVLAIMSTFVGLINSPLADTRFAKWTENEVLEGILQIKNIEHEFDWAVAGPSLACAAAGILLSLWYYKVKNGNLGLLARGGIFKAGYTFLKNRYYLDHLWTGVVVGSIKGPIAKGAYWVNQNVIDGIVNATGRFWGHTAAKFTYEVIDQKGIDGLVNGAGATASEGGGLLRLLQTGRVQNYAAIFVAAAGLAALGIALFV